MIKFFVNNLVDHANVVPSTQNNLFPIANIKDPRRTKVFRSTDNSSSIVFDLIESSDIDSFLIVSNPLTGFGISTITVEANATDNWTSPSFSTTMTFSTKHGIGIKELDTKITYRFVRLVLTSTLGYCEISNLFIGMKTQADRGINYGWTFKDDDLSVIKENRYGQKFSDIIGRQRIFGGTINNLDDVNLELLLSMTDLVGKTKPFFVKIGCSSAVQDPYRFTSMVFFTSIPQNSNRFYKNWGYPIQLEEAK